VPGGVVGHRDIGPTVPQSLQPEECATVILEPAVRKQPRLCRYADDQRAGQLGQW
jgi:hypothetical protein